MLIIVGRVLYSRVNIIFTLVRTSEGLLKRDEAEGFHGVELLFTRGVISFSKLDHRPSDQAYRL